jgi:hypothetical protein
LLLAGIARSAVPSLVVIAGAHSALPGSDDRVYQLKRTPRCNAIVTVIFLKHRVESELHNSDGRAFVGGHVHDNSGGRDPGEAGAFLRIRAA